MFSNLLSGGGGSSSSNNNPSRGRPGPANKQNEDPSDLHTLLPTPALRTNLALLFLLCTDAMRKDILTLFEPPPAPAPDQAPLLTPSKEDVQDLLYFEDAPSPPARSSQMQKESERRAQRAKAATADRRRQELGSTHMLGLRRAAVAHFDAWRARVLRRVCDVLTVSTEVVKRARKEAVARQKVDDVGVQNRGLLDQADRSDDKPKKWFYDGVQTSLLKDLEDEKRALLLNCCLLLLLSLESYSGYSRTLLLRLTASLRVDGEKLTEYENQVAKGLLLAASQMDADEYTKKQAANNASSRKFKIGLATVAGAALIGVTGGLAAPLLMAGVGSVFGALGLGAVSGLLGAVAGSPVLIAGLFGAYGGKMTGKMVEEMAKDVEDFRFVPLQGPPSDPRDPRHQVTDQNQVSSAPDLEMQNHKLRLVIGIPGWLISNDDILHPASVLVSPGTETFALRWEVTALLSLGVSLTSVLRTYIWEGAKFELVRRSLFGTLAAGLWPLGLLKMARVIDNPFHIGRLRADKAGIVLAHALIGRCQGERPVTLVGYSLGARVVYSCLLELAAQNAFGLVEDVVMMGAPTPSNGDEWTKMRAVVTGRLVNAYSEQDFILGLLYRASSAQLDVAGLQAVLGVHGVENVNVSRLVDGHIKYRYVVGKILQQIEFETLSLEGAEREAEELALQDKKQDKEVVKEQDADKEAAAVQRKVNAVLNTRSRGGPITMVDVEVEDLQKKAELLRLAEEREGQASQRDPLSMEECSTTDDAVVPKDGKLDSKTIKKQVEETVGDSQDLEHSIASRPRIQIQDLESDSESVGDGPIGDMAFLDPEPEPDSEPETEHVKFGSPGKGINMTWKGK